LNNKDQDQVNIKEECTHKNTKSEGGYLVCQDCGLILNEDLQFDRYKEDKYFISQQDYEKHMRVKDSKARQDPAINEKYRRLKILERWYRDYELSFAEQKRTIDLLKSYGIGLNVDQIKFQQIKQRYLKYNKNHRKTYQNMVIIFLAIIWMEIKDTTNIRIEKFIEVCNELGHKINKKMLNNAMQKIKKTEEAWIKFKNESEIENEIKNRIKILFQKDLNNIPYEKLKEHFLDKSDYEKLKVEMQILADKYINNISYEYLKNLNYKAFTAGLIYYIGQTFDKSRKKIFTQSLIEETTKFSSTTIRKKYHILKDILGHPKKQSNLLIN